MLLLLAAALALWVTPPARAAEAPTLELGAGWYRIVEPWRYEEARRFERGWHRAAGVVAVGGRVSAPVAGRVRFAGRVAGRQVVTLDARIDGAPVIVTLTGLERISVAEGVAVEAGGVLGRGSRVQVGAYDPERRSRYFRVTGARHVAPAAENADGDRTTISGAIARRLGEAIAGTARLDAPAAGHASAGHASAPRATRWVQPADGISPSTPWSTSVLGPVRGIALGVFELTSRDGSRPIGPRQAHDESHLARATRTGDVAPHLAPVARRVSRQHAGHVSAPPTAYRASDSRIAAASRAAHRNGGPGRWTGAPGAGGGAGGAGSMRPGPVLRSQLRLATGVADAGGASAGQDVPDAAPIGSSPPEVERGSWPDVAGVLASLLALAAIAAIARRQRRQAHRRTSKARTQTTMHAPFDVHLPRQGPPDDPLWWATLEDPSWDPLAWPDAQTGIDPNTSHERARDPARAAEHA